MPLMNLIETFFIFSLAVSFFLILMLVYHFKQRMATLEQKCDTMVSIINDIARELTSVKQVTTNYMMTSAMSSYHIPPPFHTSHMDTIEELIPEEEEDDDESYEDGDDGETDSDVDSVEDDAAPPTPIHKIVVSDTEDDHIVEDSKEDIHVIRLDDVVEDIATPLDEPMEEPHTESMDYRKMNLSALRALVQSKGLIDDASKMKKQELISLLESDK
jgi:hypothetical protein